MSWEAEMKCRSCPYTDPGRILPEGSRGEALASTLTCPNCDLEEGLVVIESTLKRWQDRGN